MSKALSANQMLPSPTRAPSVPNSGNTLSEPARDNSVYIKILQKIATFQVLLPPVSRAGRSFIFILNCILLLIVYKT